MALLDVLREEWRERACLNPVERMMTINQNGLVLGAGTVLAKMQRGVPNRGTFAIAGAEERILALLSAACGTAVNPRVLGYIRRASAAWGAGETCLALIHLALSGVPRLDDDDAGFRLFLSERLLDRGCSPRDLLKACDIDPAVIDLLKAGFNPDEPRVPAGNPDGGQWTTEDSGDDGPAGGGGAGGDAGEEGDGEDDRESEGGGGDGSGFSTRPDEESAGAGDDTGRSPIVLHGYATVYDEGLRGVRTAAGERYDPSKMTAAVLPGTIPLRSIVTVTLDSDPTRSVEVYVNDYGLYRVQTNPDGSKTRIPIKDHVIDLSTAAFRALTGRDRDRVRVTVTLKSRPGG